MTQATQLYPAGFIRMRPDGRCPWFGQGWAWGAILIAKPGTQGLRRDVERSSFPRIFSSSRQFSAQPGYS